MYIWSSEIYDVFCEKLPRVYWTFVAHLISCQRPLRREEMFDLACAVFLWICWDLSSVFIYVFCWLVNITLLWRGSELIFLYFVSRVRKAAKSNAALHFPCSNCALAYTCKRYMWPPLGARFQVYRRAIVCVCVCYVAGYTVRSQYRGCPVHRYRCWTTANGYFYAMLSRRRKLIDDVEADRPYKVSRVCSLFRIFPLPLLLLSPAFPLFPAFTPVRLKCGLVCAQTRYT